MERRPDEEGLSGISRPPKSILRTSTPTAYALNGALALSGQQNSIGSMASSGANGRCAHHLAALVIGLHVPSGAVCTSQVRVA